MNSSSSTPPAVLVVTMGTDYTAPARMPFELKRAGFKVAMLAPREALATHTAYVDQLGYFPEQVSLFDWVLTLAGAVRSVNPALILPADDITLRTMMQLVLDPPEGLRPDIQAELSSMIRQSLGDPAGWLNSIDKARLFELATQNGIAVADGGVAADQQTAVGIAARVGYPVIVRLMFGTASKSVQRCNSDAEIRAAVRNLPGQDAWSPAGPPRVVVQKWIPGAIVNRASVAWNGQEVAGFTRGRLATHPAPLGAASVVEFAGIPAVAEVTRRVFGLVGMHGMVGTQFVLDPETQIPYLIEINRRMIPASHSGARVGVDLAAALFSAVSGQQWGGPQDLPPGPGLRLALFPQEWYRDVQSTWLRTLPTDAPWQDPGLLQAMLRQPYRESAATDGARGAAATTTVLPRSQ